MTEIFVEGLGTVEIAGDEPTEEEKAIIAKKAKELPRRRRPGPVERMLGGPATEPVREAARGAAAGMFNILEAPGRGVRAGMEALGFEAPPTIQELYGPDLPTTHLGRGFEIGTEGALSTLPVIGLYSRGRQATTALGRSFQEISTGAFERPLRFFGFETVTGIGAGVAGFEALRRFPDDPVAEQLAMLGGGLSTGLSLAGLRRAGPPALRSVGRGAVTIATGIPLAGRGLAFLIKNIRQSFSVQGARDRAVARLERAEPDLGRAVRADPDILPDVDITAAQRTGSPGLLSLEKAIIDESTELQKKSQEQIASVTRAIREALTVEGADEASIDDALEYLRILTDTRLQMAALKVEDQLAKLGTTATREDINRLARVELDKATQAIRAQETALFALIPDGEVGMDKAVALYNKLARELPRALRKDMPVEAKRLLDEGSGQFIGLVDDEGELTGKAAIKEMRGLYSNLREEARLARSDGRFNKARIADDLADAIADDLSALEGDPAAVAVAYSRAVKERFRRGPVGKILGFAREGGPSVPESLTLESTLGGSSPAAREASDRLIDAIKFAEEAGGVDSQQMELLIRQFITDEFNRAARPDGQFSSNAASRFIERNQDLLGRFPDLKEEMNAAATLGRELRTAERMDDVLGTRAAIFLKGDPQTVIRRLLREQNVEKATQILVDQLASDPTGRALKGFQQGFLDEMVGRSLMTATDASGQQLISGRRLLLALDRPQVQKVMMVLFPDEGVRQRIRQAAKTAELIERAVLARTPAEGIIGDEPGLIANAITGILGAAGGRRLTKAMGVGANVQIPGMVAHVARKAQAAGLRDPAKHLLIEAFQDEDLFDVLAAPITEATAPVIRRKLNAWLFSVLTEQNLDMGGLFRESPHPEIQ